MGSQPYNQYPSILNPFIVLDLDPSNYDMNKLKKAFKTKMQGNEDPKIRLAYEMIINPNNYQMVDNYVFSVTKLDIFYYTHVGGLKEIKYLIEQNKNLLNAKDSLKRTIFYIAARNGYYSLCKYLLEKGANFNEVQQHGITPLETAKFYGHNHIVELINEYKNQFDCPNKSDNKYTIYEFDEILKINHDSNHYKFFNFLNEGHSPTHFISISIFDKNKYNSYKTNFNNAYNNKTFTSLEKKCIGAMLGLSIGDAIGSRVEFLPLDYNYKEIKDMGNNIAGKFKLKPGQWTDDTSMSLCLADSLLENNGKFNGHDFMKRLISWFYFGYNNTFKYDNERENRHSFGLGGNIAGSFKTYIKQKGINQFTEYGDKNTSGNGSLIRNAPIPICFYRNLNLALDIAEKQSKVTHRGNEAAGCCQLMTFIIIKILNGEELKNILDNLKYEFNCKYNSVNYLAKSIQEGNDPDKNWNWNNKIFKYSLKREKSNPGYIGSYSMDALAMALHILKNTNSFQEAILKGVNLRGDADSVGAIIGQIAGAYYGLDNIPKEWIDKIYQWDKEKEIALRGYILSHLLENKA